MNTHKHFYLLPNWRYCTCDNHLELTAPALGHRYKIEGYAPSKMEQLFEALQSGVNESDIYKLAHELNVVGRDVMSIIAWLGSMGAVINVEPPRRASEDNLYDRQLRFFAAFERADITARHLNDRLMHSRIALIGLGGIGCWIALLCARVGIRNIVAFDYDIVERSNLPRQILYRASDIGKRKVEAAARLLLDVDPSISFLGIDARIERQEDISPYIRDADLVFNGFGYTTARDLSSDLSGIIAKACHAEGVPCLNFGGPAVGPLTIPGRTACLHCALLDSSFKPIVDRFRALQELKGPNPVFTPRQTLFASIAVWEASRFLSGCTDSAVINSILMLDTWGYIQHRRINVRQLPECPLCGGGTRQ